MFSFGEMYFDMAGYTLLEDVQNALGQGLDTANADVSGTLFSIMNNVMIPIGCGLLIIYFILELIDHSTKENVTDEVFFRSLIKFVIGYILITQAQTIFEAIQDLANSATSMFGQEAKNTIPAGLNEKAIDDAINKKINDSLTGGLLDGITLYIKPVVIYIGWLIPWGISKATWVICMVVAYSRSIELVIRTILAPVALPDIFQHGMHGGGFRYVKRYASVAFQSLVISAVIIAIGALSGLQNHATDANAIAELVVGMAGMGEIWLSLVWRIAGTGIILKSQTIANDLFGA